MANESDTPVCCGRKMRREGSQLVCKKCRAWVDPGVTAAADKGQAWQDADRRPERYGR